ncbi:methionyl-tRNA formyltransferase [Salinibacter sp.]|uniref:methionyl-tRNA formyltransferase n=1 Tax=Salinibacter sp. TaxID=2065818 RepID=UPI0021E879C8|nr:formyltransferase family protein [Salinibacter sp.]
MDVIVVTQDDPFYMPLFFRHFFNEVSEKIKLRNVVCLKPFDESFSALIGRMYGLYGPVNVVRRGVSYVTRKASDALGLGSNSVVTAAQRRGVSVEMLDTVNDSSFIERIEERHIDVILSVSAPEIFAPSLLNAPTWGCLNVHTAKLPKYRGMLPTFWALYHGDEEIGVTIHTMEEEVDHGQIAKQSTFPVSPSDTLDDVIKQGKREGGRLAAQALNTLAEGEIQLRPMEGEESYFSFPSAEERRELQRQGRCLL